MSNFGRKSLIQVVLVIIIVVTGVLYISYTYKRFDEEERERILYIAKSIEAALPTDDIKKLGATEEDIKKPEYIYLKNILKEVIRINSSARFSYVYMERYDKIFFCADSEAEDSKDYSPPGQEYTEAKPQDKQPFKDGKELVTEVLTDRWGTWISVLVPIKDETTGNVIAVFGMDFEAENWNRFILLHSLESIVVVILLLFVLFISIRLISKNSLLRDEISKQKLSEEILRESEEKIRAIFNTANIGIGITDKHGKYLMFNDWWIKNFGYEADEIKNLTNFDITYSEDEKTSKEWFLKIIEGKIDKYQIEKRFVRKNNSIFWGDLSVSAIKDRHNNITNVIGIVADITESKNAQELIRQEKSFSQAALDSLPGLFYLFDDKGKFLRWNKNFEEVSGYSADEIAQLSPLDLFEGDDKIKIADAIKESFQKGQTRVEANFLSKDKSKTPTLFSGSNFQFEDKHCLVGMGIDITYRKLVEKEIRLKNEELLNLNSEKDKFFSIIAHDLRSPFTGFLGFTEILKSDFHKMTIEELQNIFRKMNDSANRLFNLLTNLLDWAMMQRGVTTFHPTKQSLKEIAESSVDIFAESAKQKGVEIEKEIPEDFIIFADKNMLTTIIRNLVSNAIKFTSKSGRITISANAFEDNVVISVKDSGIGMSNEMINDLFKLDKKTKRAGTDNEPSTGLGLYLCKEYAEKHNGKIWVVSEEGKGSEFIISLPST